MGANVTRGCGDRIMSIDELIERLRQLRDTHGGRIAARVTTENIPHDILDVEYVPARSYTTGPGSVEITGAL